MNGMFQLSKVCWRAENQNLRKQYTMYKKVKLSSLSALTVIDMLLIQAIGQTEGGGNGWRRIGGFGCGWGAAERAGGRAGHEIVRVYYTIAKLSYTEVRSNQNQKREWFAPTVFRRSRTSLIEFALTLSSIAGVLQESWWKMWDTELKQSPQINHPGTECALSTCC